MKSTHFASPAQPAQESFACANVCVDEVARSSKGATGSFAFVDFSSSGIHESDGASCATYRCCAESSEHSNLSMIAASGRCVTLSLVDEMEANQQYHHLDADCTVVDMGDHVHGVHART